MRNYVLVLILCGFLIDTNLSQDNQVFTFDPNQPNSNVPIEFLGNFFRPEAFERVNQGVTIPIGQAVTQRQDQGKLHIQPPRQNQNAIQGGAGIPERQIPSQNQNINGNAQNQVRVIYIDRPQQEARPSSRNTQQGDQNNFDSNNAVLVRNPSRPQPESFIQQAPQKQNSPARYDQPTRIERPEQFQQPLSFQGPEYFAGNPFLALAQQQNEYFTLPSEQRGNPSNPRQDQNLYLQSQQTIRIPEQQTLSQQNVRTSSNQNQNPQNIDGARYLQFTNSAQRAHAQQKQQSQPNTQQVVRTRDREQDIGNENSILTPTHRKLEVPQAAPAQRQVISSGAPTSNSRAAPAATAAATQKPITVQRPAAAQKPNQIQTSNVIITPGQTYSSSYRHEYSTQSQHMALYKYQVSPDGRQISPPVKEHEENHTSEMLNFQAQSSVGNPPVLGVSRLTAGDPSNKSFYVNNFAPDSYTTKKPCEICCQENEVEPCKSCCSVTKLLYARTLKTVVG